MRQSLFILALSLAAAPYGARAQSTSFEDAMAACRSSVSEDSSGNVNSTEIDTCMKNYGFEKPADGQGGPGGGGPGAGVDNTALKAAMDACSASGQPGSTEFETCMTSKGFTKPADDGRGHGHGGRGHHGPRPGDASATGTDTSTDTSTDTATASSSGASRFSPSFSRSAR